MCDTQLHCAAVLGHTDEHGIHRGELVTVRHNGLNPKEAARIRSQHSDTTRILQDGYLQVRVMDG